MNDADRRARNTAKLAECYPVFHVKLRQVLGALERQGFRPRIQEAYRSPADQLKAYQSGKSHLRYGLHNATAADGRWEALAADVLDDDHPTAPPLRYLLALAVAAADAGLQTGILWGLSGGQRTKTMAALHDQNLDAAVHVGWDPTHVQVRGLTPKQVRDGERPTATAPPPEEDDDMTAEDRAVLQVIADKLDALRKAEDRHYHLLNFGRNPGTKPGVVDADHVGTVEIMEAVRSLGVGGGAIDYDVLADKVVDRLKARL